MPAMVGTRRAVLLGGARWTPASLGADLLAFWDAEQAGTLSLAGSAVTTWADAKNGYAPTQATSGFKPVYSATSFNGRPGVTFDGTDDELTLGSVPLPTGSAACEIWSLVDQAEAGASGGTRAAFSYGLSFNSDRRINRVTGGTNRGRVTAGTGSAAVNVDNGTVDLTGRHVIRGVFESTQISISVDGSALTTAPCAINTGTTRLRIGAAVGTSAGNFWLGTHNCHLVTSLLSAAQAAQLLAYLKTRGGIA